MNVVDPIRDPQKIRKIKENLKQLKELPSLHHSYLQKML
jgi:hypothetical protein